MFNPHLTAEKLNDNHNNMVGHIGIKFTEVSDGCLKATMPVDHRTKQPMGLLHGGASAVLAETLGSVGALCYIDMATQAPVGLEINCNHIKSAREGFVTGTATPIHLGKRTHVWEIKIHDEDENLICISRMTVAIIDKK
ncbi:hotdog fold thioesterase [Sediminitomix flava]|uniref:1,4-dihydroxy-2-naphthoyl-CoA hydrolase n=1 Tax=Sediminitomix flava TaxID=379075 RepID=A0A315Z7H1_SEDFL|nr:hotdog fold thioesterase [Sediminitomix flava]PWJ40871.1 1,4-dihydroxy-2-naphthoyl-CoA hydrolase [Sediminitomix flava]